MLQVKIQDLKAASIIAEKAGDPRYSLNGVHVVRKDGAKTLVQATDGRMAVRIETKPIEAPEAIFEGLNGSAEAEAAAAFVPSDVVAKIPKRPRKDRIPAFGTAVVTKEEVCAISETARFSAAVQAGDRFPDLDRIFDMATGQGSRPKAEMIVSVSLLSKMLEAAKAAGVEEIVIRPRLGRLDGDTAAGMLVLEARKEEEEEAAAASFEAVVMGMTFR